MGIDVKVRFADSYVRAKRVVVNIADVAEGFDARSTHSGVRKPVRRLRDPDGIGQRRI